MALNVLLVEDSPTQAAQYCMILEDVGLNVHSVETGQAALDYAYRYIPDIIILDLNLPDMDGVQVCHRLNRTPETHSIPVIMLTSRDKASDAMVGLKAGAIDYIAKDEFAKEVLLNSLEQLGMFG